MMVANPVGRAETTEDRGGNLGNRERTQLQASRSGFMRTEQIFKILTAEVEDTRFRDWLQGQTPEWRFTYLCEYGTIWKFGPKEWWQFVKRTVRHNGVYDLPLSRARRMRPKHIFKGDDHKYYSSSKTVRCVNPLDWTVEDWKNELIRKEPAALSA